MFINRVGFTAVGQSVFCAQIYKQTSRHWRYSSNVRSVDRKDSDLLHSDEEILTKLKKTRKSAHGTDPAGQAHAPFSTIPKKTNSVRVFDKKAANIIAKFVINVFNKRKVVLEFDAGSGLLSSALLTRGMKNFVALETLQDFSGMLETVKQNHEVSFHFFFKSIHDVISYTEEEFSSNLPGISILKEVQIIGNVPSWHLLVEISRRLRDYRSFLSGKSLTLCLCLPEEQWKQFLDNKVQKMCVVERILFQLAFEYKILTTLEKKSFFFTLKKREQSELKPDDNMVLIHVKSKPTVNFDLSELQVFLTQFHNCSSRNRLVIPSLERWAPSCGEELVRRGMPVFTRFSDLRPNELLEVFLYFKSLPNIEASEFLADWRSDFES